jgi:hypothetical protein
MRQLQGERAAWALEEFGRAELGDRRRTARLVQMATRAAESPAGKVSEVFANGAEQQGAYDFLECKHVSTNALVKAVGICAAERGAAERFAFVAVDGSSLTLADHAKGKGFGSVGPLSRGGLWAEDDQRAGGAPGRRAARLVSRTRTKAKSQSRKDKRRRNLKRKASEKETQYWLDTIDEACARGREAGAALWFQLDREADNRTLLLKLSETGELFTVRSSWDRLVEASGHDKQYLRQQLALEAPGGEYILDVSGGPKRTARHARMVVRWSRVALRLRDKWSKTERRLELSGRLGARGRNDARRREAARLAAAHEHPGRIARRRALRHLRLHPTMAGRGVPQDLEERRLRHRNDPATNQGSGHALGYDPRCRGLSGSNDSSTSHEPSRSSPRASS